MKHNNKYIKLISFVLTGIFIFQQVAWTAEDSNIQPSKVNTYDDNIAVNHKILPENIYIPEDLAEIETKNFDKNKEVIFNLQDCHSSLSAQYSIVNILKKLLSDYEMNIVAIEGASGYIDTSILKSFPDKSIKENTASVLMKEGKLSAGEFFSVISDKDVALYGVEDQDLYAKNLESFRKLYKGNKDVLSSVKKLINLIETAEDKTYSKELSMFIFKSRLHDASKISFEIYGKYLMRICKEKGIDTRDIKNITSFLEAIKREKGVDFDEATLESKKLLSELMAIVSKPELEEMVLKTLDFNKDKIGPVEYHDWLLSFAKLKGKDISSLSELIKYVDYIKYYQKLDIMGLQSEIDLLEERILDKLFTGEKDRELYKLAEMVRLMKSLFSIQLTPEDVSYVKDNLSELTEENIKKVIPSVSDQLKLNNLSVNLSEIRKRALDALGFYQIAEKRNMAMLSNTIKSMRAEGKQMAALISGGHHSRGLSRLMQEKGVSYFILLPKFSVDSERPYVAILTKKKGPYRELITSGSYDLALEAYFDSGDLEEFHEMIALVLGGWVLKGNVDIKSLVKEWARSYEEAYHKITSTRKSALKYSQLKPEEFIRFLDEIVISDKNKDFCKVNIDGKVYKVDAEGISVVSQAEALTTPSKQDENMPGEKKKTISIRTSELINLFSAFNGSLSPEKFILHSFFPIMLKPIILTILNIAAKNEHDAYDTKSNEHASKGDKVSPKAAPSLMLNEFTPFKGLDADQMSDRSIRIRALKNSINNIIENGVSTIVLPVQITSDNVLVSEWGKIKHEGVDRCVFELTFDQYQAAPGIDKVLRIDELIEAAKGRIALDFNIKTWAHDLINDEGVLYQDAVILHLVNMVKKNNMQDKVTVVSYKTEYVNKVKDLDDKINVGLTIKEEVSLDDFKLKLTSTIDEAKAGGIFSISLYPEQLSEQVINKIHAAGLKLIVKPSKKDIPKNLWKKIDYLFVREKDLVEDTPRMSNEIAVESEEDSFIDNTYQKKLEKVIRDKFPDSDIGIEGFVKQFCNWMPPRLLNDEEAALDVLLMSYRLALRVIKDPSRISFAFKASRKKGISEKLITVYYDTRPDVGAYVKDSIMDAGVQTGSVQGFSFNVVSANDDGAKHKIYVDIIPVSDKGSRISLEARKDIIRKLKKLSVLPLKEYAGITSIPRAMKKGYSAYWNSGEDFKVSDIVCDIIPKKAKFDHKASAIIVEEELRTFKEFIANMSEKGVNIPDGFEELVKKVNEKLWEGLVVEDGSKAIVPEIIIKPSAVSLLHEYILNRVLDLKDKLKETSDAALKIKIRQDISSFSIIDQVIREELPYMRKIDKDKVAGEIARFDSVFEKVSQEELTGAHIGGDLKQVTLFLLKELHASIRNRVEGKNYSLVAAFNEEAINIEKAIDKNIKTANGDKKKLKLADGIRDKYKLLKQLVLTEKNLEKEGEIDLVVKQFGKIDEGEKHILFVEGDLLPSDIESLYPKLSGIVSVSTGPTAHWVLVAKNYGIPVFHIIEKDKKLNMKEIWQEVGLGHFILVDGIKGRLTIAPDTEKLKEFESRAREGIAYNLFCEHKRKEPARIGDDVGNESGAIIKVKCNADDKAEMVKALDNGASGIGLVRTEFWLSEKTPFLKEFITRPDDEEAREGLRKYLKDRALGMLRHVSGKEITFRTFDVAEDKDIPWDHSDLTGVNYYRNKVSGRNLLEIELEAFYSAVAELAIGSFGAPGKTIQINSKDDEDKFNSIFDKIKTSGVKIMIPQVDSREDMEYVLGFVDQAIDSISKKYTADETSEKFLSDALNGNISLGAMVEDLEAIKNLKEILPLVGFISIGTNDLVRSVFKYLEKSLGVENLRRSGMAEIISKFREVQPEVISKIEEIISEVYLYMKESGRVLPVTICGDTATIDGYILQIVFLADKYGIDLSPSVPEVRIGETKAFIRHIGEQDDLNKIFLTKDKHLKDRIEKKVIVVLDRIKNNPAIDNILRSVMEGTMPLTAASVHNEPSEETVLKEEPIPVEDEDLSQRVLDTGDLTITNSLGLHSRPAAKIIKLSQKYGVDIIMKSARSEQFNEEYENVKIEGMDSFLTRGLSSGSRISLRVRGPGKKVKEFISEILGLKDGAEDVFKADSLEPMEADTDIIYLYITDDDGFHTRPTLLTLDAMSKFQVSLELVKRKDPGEDLSTERVQISNSLDFFTLGIPEGAIVGFEVKGEFNNVEKFIEAMNNAEIGISGEDPGEIVKVKPFIGFKSFNEAVSEKNKREEEKTPENVMDETIIGDPTLAAEPAKLAGEGIKVGFSIKTEKGLPWTVVAKLVKKYGVDVVLEDYEGYFGSYDEIFSKDEVVALGNDMLDMMDMPVSFMAGDKGVFKVMGSSADAFVNELLSLDGIDGKGILSKDESVLPVALPQVEKDGEEIKNNLIPADKVEMSADEDKTIGKVRFVATAENGLPWRDVARLVAKYNVEVVLEEYNGFFGKQKEVTLGEDLSDMMDLGISLIKKDEGVFRIKGDMAYDFIEELLSLPGVEGETVYKTEESVSDIDAEAVSKEIDIQVVSDIVTGLKPRYYIVYNNLEKYVKEYGVELLFLSAADKGGREILSKNLKYPLNIKDINSITEHEYIGKIFASGTQLKLSVKGKKKNVIEFIEKLKSMTARDKKIFNESRVKKRSVLDIFSSEGLLPEDAEKVMELIRKYDIVLSFIQIERGDGNEGLLEPVHIDRGGKVQDIVDLNISGPSSIEVEVSGKDSNVIGFFEELFEMNVFKERIPLEIKGVSTGAEVDNTLNGSGSGLSGSKKEKPERDLKGPGAGDSDILLKQLIEDNKIVEVYSQDNKLVCHRVKWVDNYIPERDRDKAKGQEIDVNDIFTLEQQRNILEWIQNKGSLPDGRGMVRFRVVKDDIYIGWNNDIEHSNICHAGYRDGCIYIGQHLLSSIFDYPEHPFLKTILDDDEYMHLKDKDFDCRVDHEAYKKRLNSVAEYCESLDNYINRKTIKPGIEAEEKNEVQWPFPGNKLLGLLKSFVLRLLNAITDFMNILEDNYEGEEEWGSIKNEKTHDAIIDDIERDIDFIMDGQWSDGSLIMEGLKPTDKARKEHVQYVIEMYKAFIAGDYNKVYKPIKTIMKKNKPKDVDEKTYKKNMALQQRKYFKLLKQLTKIFKQLSNEDKQVLFLAVILHDIGYTKTSESRSRFHTSEGSGPAQIVLKHYGIDNDLIIRKVQAIIANHDKFPDIGVDWLIGDFPKDEVLRKQLLIMTAVDSMGKTKEQPKGSGEYIVKNILVPEYFEEMLKMYSEVNRMTPEQFLEYRLECAGIKRPFQLSRPELKLSEKDLIELREMVKNDDDDVFRQMWTDKIRVHIFPLFMLLKEQTKSDYIPKLYKLMKLLAHISNVYIEDGYGEDLEAIDFDPSDGDRDEDYQYVLDSLETFFQKSIKEINEENVRKEIIKSNWTNVFGLKISRINNDLKEDTKKSEETNIAIKTPTKEERFELNIAMPEEIYKKIERFIGMKTFLTRLDLPWGIKIIKVKSESTEDISKEIDSLTQKSKGMLVIIDKSTFDLNKSDEALVSDITDIILEFTKSIKNDVINLISPETKDLNSRSIKSLDKYKIKEIMAILVRMHNKYRSYKLNEKSVYQMRLENAFESYKNKNDSVRLLGAINKDQRTKYLVHFADSSEFIENNNFLIVPPGLEIQKRRIAQKVEDKKDPYKDKFYIVGPDENMTEKDKNIFKNRIMDLWMLKGVIGEDDIVILDKKEGGYKTSEIFGMVNGNDIGATNNNTGFRVICGDLTYDRNSAEKNILQLDLSSEARHNRDQYSILVNLLSLLDSENQNFPIFSRVFREKYNLFIYVPSAMPVDLDREIRSYYDRYKREVLIKA